MYNVFTVKCVKCEALVGESSADYHFIAGADDIWVQEELLEEIEGYYTASNYRLSSGSIWASYRARSLKRGWNECGGRSFQDALHRAFRIFVAVKENFNSGGDAGNQAVNLLQCPACSQGCVGLHVDGNFKLKQRGHTGSAHGAPLTHSAVGSKVVYDSENGSLRCEEMTTFRHCRTEMGITSTSIPNGACNDFRAGNGAQKSSSNTHNITGVHLGVCRHNVSNDGVSQVIDTPGEGIEYALFAIAKQLHLSGRHPLPEVFGHVPNPPHPPLHCVFSDIPCTLWPHIQNWFPEFIKLVHVKLGVVHGNAHTCQNQYTGQNCKGVGLSSGENSEAFWSKLVGMSSCLEHCGGARWYEKITHAIKTENLKSIKSCVTLLSRMARRSVLSIVKYFKDLDMALKVRIPHP